MEVSSLYLPNSLLNQSGPLWRYNQTTSSSLTFPPLSFKVTDPYVTSTTVATFDDELSGLVNSSQREEEHVCRGFRFVFIGVVCLVTCVLGLVGNTLSFLVYSRDGSSPVASLLLQSLAVSDNLFLLLWLVHYSIRECLSYLEMNLWPLNLVRMYTFPVLYMTQMVTIWLTVAIAMNRYMAVCIPYRAQHICTLNNVYKEVLVIAGFSIAYNVPRFFELQADTHTQRITRTAFGLNDSYRLIYVDGLYYCFTFFLPLLILSFVNTRVVCAYRATKQRRQRMMTRRSRNDSNITLVMILVVGVFMLCQGPARIVQMVWRYDYQNCTQVQFYLIHISNSLEVINSSVNFFIYVIFRRRFTDILFSRLCACAMLSGIARRRHSCTRSLTTHAIGLTSYRGKLTKCAICTPKGTPTENGNEGAADLEIVQSSGASGNAVVVSITGNERELELLFAHASINLEERRSDLIMREQPANLSCSDSKQNHYEIHVRALTPGQERSVTPDQGQIMTPNQGQERTVTPCEGQLLPQSQGRVLTPCQ